MRRNDIEQYQMQLGCLFYLLAFCALVSSSDPWTQNRDFLLVNSNVEITNSPQNEHHDDSVHQQRVNIRIENSQLKDPIELEFNSYDLDGDGVLKIDELQESFKADGDAIIRELISKGDHDLSGTLTFEEFFRFRTRDPSFDL